MDEELQIKMSETLQDLQENVQRIDETLERTLSAFNHPLTRGGVPGEHGTATDALYRIAEGIEELTKVIALKS